MNRNPYSLQRVTPTARNPYSLQRRPVPPAIPAEQRQLALEELARQATAQRVLTRSLLLKLELERVTLAAIGQLARQQLAERPTPTVVQRSMGRAGGRCVLCVQGPGGSAIEFLGADRAECEAEMADFRRRCRGAESERWFGAGCRMTFRAA